MSKVVVKCAFGVDKMSAAGYTAHYGSRPNREKKYDYWADEALNIQKGDFVVVNTPTWGLTVVQVESVEPEDEGHGYRYGELKWVIDKVDMEAAVRRQEREKEVKELKRQLDKMVAEAKERINYETVLAGNSEAAKLLERFRELTN